MTVAERIARQQERMRGLVKTPAAQDKPAGGMSVADRIARQQRIVKVNAAVAATKTPPPDYVYREPRMPARIPTAEERLAMFREDRTYDDVKGNADMVSQIRSPEDMAKVIRAEQPKEYVSGDREQVRSGGPSFRTIDNRFLEGPGYRSLPQVDENARDRIIDAPETPEPAVVPALKIDLNRMAQNAPVQPPVPAVEQPPVQATAKPDGPIEMNAVQRQMLAAMRAQRMNKGF